MRHRTGGSPTDVRPRAWDATKRADARRLQAQWPCWLVLYGPWSRRFWAAAMFPTPEPLAVEARTAPELDEMIREAEMIATLPATAEGTPR